MDKIMFAVFALIILPSIAGAQQTNGCGSGVERYVVPDRLKIIGCNFKTSCDSHDVCYGSCSLVTNRSQPQCQYLRCTKGGDLYGSKECDGIRFRRLAVAADERRVKCDANFMVDIVRNNPGNSRCTLFSALYPFAVRILGSKAFVGIDSAAVFWPEEEKNAYAAAVNEMFLKWSDSQILQYNKTLREGNANVDLGRPIRFDPNVGFVNTP